MWIGKPMSIMGIGGLFKVAVLTILVAHFSPFSHRKYHGFCCGRWIFDGSNMIRSPNEAFPNVRLPQAGRSLFLLPTSVRSSVGTWKETYSKRDIPRLRCRSYHYHPIPSVTWYEGTGRWHECMQMTWILTSHRRKDAKLWAAQL